MATKKTSSTPSKSRSKADKRPVEKKSPAMVRPMVDAQAQMSQDELKALIAQAAYLRAERRGFTPGQEIDDWVAAEAEVITRLGLRA